MVNPASVLCRDPNSGPGLNARLGYTPSEDETVFAAAGGRTDTTGAYVLAVEDIDDIPNNVTTTEFLEVDVIRRSTIDFPQDEDWFRVEFEAGTTYVFRLNRDPTAPDSLRDPLLQLFDTDGNTIAQDNDSGRGRNARVVFTPSKDETVFAVAAGFESDGGYVLSVEAIEDIPGILATTEMLPIGGNARSTIDFANDQDWFEVQLEAGFDYIFVIAGDGDTDSPLLAPLLRLFDDQGSLIDSDASGLAFTSTEGQTVFASAGGARGATGDYWLQVVADEFPNRIDTETILAIDSEVASTLDFPGDEDWFQVDLKDNQRYVFDLISDDSCSSFIISVLKFYNNQGDLIEEVADFQSRLVFESTENQLLFASAGSLGSPGSYRLAVNVLSEPISIKLSEINGLNGFAINSISVRDYSRRSLSGVGDVNGDGFDDVLVSAENSYDYQTGSGTEGRSYLIFGAANGFGEEISLDDLNGSNGFIINGINPGDYAGNSVSGAVDLNSDGFDDLIVGARYASGAGQSYVIFGSGAGFDAEIQLADLDGGNGVVINGIDRYDRSGESVSGAGDVNGDGFDDLIIGAPGLYYASRGYSYVIFGGGARFATETDLADLDGSNGFVLNGVNERDYSGFSVSGAGDVNDDGFDDLIVGAPDADPNGFSSGQSYVVFGSGEGFDAEIELANLDGSNGFALNGVDESNRSGTTVSGAGDVNGDGVDDLIIGAPRAQTSLNTYVNEGQSYVVFGSGSGFEAQINLGDLDGSDGFVINGVDVFTEESGRSVRGAGDVNGDGFDDIIIGAETVNRYGFIGEGQSYLIFGTASGFGQELDLEDLDGDNGFAIDGINFRDDSGFSVSAAGDVNNDGFDDLIIGAPEANLNAYDAGQSYVIFGGPDLPASFNADDTATVTSLVEPDLFVV